MIVSDIKNQARGLDQLKAATVKVLQATMGGAAPREIKILRVNKKDIKEMKKKFGLKIKKISKEYNQRTLENSNSDPIFFLETICECAKYLNGENETIIIKFMFNNQVHYASIRQEHAKQMEQALGVLQMMKKVNFHMMQQSAAQGTFGNAARTPIANRPSNTNAANAAAGAVAASKNNWWAGNKDNKKS